MIIGIDIDGIILDFERTMRTFAELYDLLILKKNGVKYPNEFDYLKRYDWTESERKNFIDQYLVYATLTSTPLLPLAKELLELLTVEGFQFYFITARGLFKKETKEAVIQVFQNNDLPINAIHWGVKDKVSKCVELGVDFMIEDNPTTCQLLHQQGIKTLYWRDKDSQMIPEDEYLREVSNVGEICRILFRLGGLKNSKEVYEKILKRKSQMK